MLLRIACYSISSSLAAFIFTPSPLFSFPFCCASHSIRTSVYFVSSLDPISVNELLFKALKDTDFRLLQSQRCGVCRRLFRSSRYRVRCVLP
ncbi:hypothetical protein C8Q79DRAFT_280102 [Trametes meyenii]|nr:hypothetical protein C8Q79DRAFT_280102 [Trametes meyenii]